MAEYADGHKRLSPSEVVALIRDLLSALEAIHPDVDRINELKRKTSLTKEEWDELQSLFLHGIVHRDIKPENLIISPTGLVLIDFNIASRIGQQVLTLSGTPRYKSPDIIPGVETWDVSPDLFATGVVLYELLCWQHPYDGDIPRADLMPRDPRQFRPELSPALAAFLLKACAPLRGDRFANARELRTALDAIDPLTLPIMLSPAAGLPARLLELVVSAPPNVNPMVREFLALSSQARRTNAGTRGMDDLARATYVETQLDTNLSASLLAGQHRLVIITGNAGDGKTAFIQQIEQAAMRAGAVVLGRTGNGCRFRYANREILTLYDGSQDEGDRTSDEVLCEFFRPMSSGDNDGVVRIAAINEGRLRDFLLVHRRDFSTLAGDIIAALDDPTKARIDDVAIIVNLNLRSVTAGGAASIFSRQLQAIVQGRFWEPCERCDYRSRCPLKHNVDTFRDLTSGSFVAERLRTLVNLLRLRRRRHLTMRDVRSLISHILFRDRTCDEIPALLASDDPLNVLDLAYFQGPGGLGVTEGSSVERGAALLAEIDVALVANPEDDRILARGRGLRRMSFPARTSDYPGELIRTVQLQAGSGYESNVVLARRAQEAARRQSYFERADDNWRSMLPYERVLEFEQALEPTNVAARDHLRKEVVRAISMYEGVTNPQLAAAGFWLSTMEQGAPGFHCFRRFPPDGFALRIPKIDSRYVEHEPDRLDFVHIQSGAILDIDIDLLEVLERLRDGHVPSQEESSGFLVNLNLFRHRLLAEPSDELFILADETLLRIAVSNEPGRLVMSEERL
jgi:hypothetical protein